MNLFKHFIANFDRTFKPGKGDQYLLAVSGGIDSMVMLDLFSKALLPFSVAHCNYQLRGNDSKMDHELVKSYCHNNNIPFFEKIFETRTYAETHKKSIQVAARDLRYEWFGQLRQEHGFQYIVTAHHADDNAETVLLNIARGTGLKGLSGIPLKAGSIIRPLLFASKQEIMLYARHENIPYRDDASNAENKYARNKIRNHVMPLLQTINTEASQHINDLSDHSRVAVAIIGEHIKNIRQKTVSENGDIIMLKMEPLIEEGHSAFYLFELINQYGFNASQVNNMLKSYDDKKTGSLFKSDLATLLVNRDHLLISLQSGEAKNTLYIDNKEIHELQLGQDTYLFECIDNNYPVFSKDHLYLDADLLQFPLMVRKWEDGDKFRPLGMKGQKKISDFLTDRKVSLFEKQSTYIIESSQKIIAILNHRISEEFKINPDTKTILQISSKTKQDA